MQDLRNILEALLFASSSPLTLDQIQAVFEEDERPEQAELKQLIDDLALDYSQRSFELLQTASGYLIQTKPQYSAWLVRMHKPSKYSRALLETLAIIAYKQPVTRADIEEIRGVAVNSQIIKNLMEREWIRISGYKDVPGKPAVYSTTKLFLDYFNLKHLNELPPLAKLEELMQHSEEEVC